jgi:hypothetical protein
MLKTLKFIFAFSITAISPKTLAMHELVQWIQKKYKDPNNHGALYWLGTLRTAAQHRHGYADLRKIFEFLNIHIHCSDTKNYLKNYATMKKWLYSEKNNSFSAWLPLYPAPSFILKEMFLIDVQNFNMVFWLPHSWINQGKISKDSTKHFVYYAQQKYIDCGKNENTHLNKDLYWSMFADENLDDHWKVAQKFKIQLNNIIFLLNEREPVYSVTFAPKNLSLLPIN